MQNMSGGSNPFLSCFVKSFDNTTGISHGNRVRRNIFGNHGSGRYYRMLSNGYTRRNDRIGANPAIVFNNNE
jgi:hypothetical protein